MSCLKFLPCLVFSYLISPAFSRSGRNFISDEQFQNITSTLRINGHQNIIFVSLDYKDTNLHTAMTRISLSLPGDYQVIRKDKKPPQKCYFEECYYTHWFHVIPSSPIIYLSRASMTYDNKNTLLFLASSIDSKHIKYYLQETSKRDLLSTVLIMTKALTYDEINIIESYFHELQENAMFFWVYKIRNQNTIVWNRVISLKGYDKVVVNKVQIDNQSRMKEEYDLQGLHLTSISLPWFPYFHLYNCNDKGMDCESAGYLKQFMDSLGTLMNFTWESHKEINNDWGLVQQDDGSWNGVTGHVLNGSYQLSVR